MSSAGLKKICLIVPCYNESKVVDLCQQAIDEAIAPLSSRYIFEIVYINDGSSDDTLELLKKLREKDSRVTVINLSRNFGKEAAMTAALDYVDGDATIILDADLQDPPSLIPDMLTIWESQGVDVVYGQRLSRSGETWFKKFTAAGFYRVINMISRVKLPQNTGDFRLMSRRTVQAVNQLREHHRFMKGLFAWVGYKQVALPYHRHPRVAGRTTWDYIKLWNFSLEGITGFSSTPLKFATLLGLAIAAFSVLFGSLILLRTLFFGTDVPGYASLMVMITFMGGIQLLSIGLLGEYVGRIFNETKRRPLYLIDEILTADPHQN